MANLTAPYSTYPIDTTHRSTTAQLPLGARAFDEDGNEYTYVMAGAAIGALQAVRLAGSALGYDDVRPTSAADQVIFGAAAGTAFAEDEYGFVLTRGIATILATDSITVGAPLATGSTAGLLAAATTSSLAPRGTAIVTDANADTDGATVFLP